MCIAIKCDVGASFVDKAIERGEREKTVRREGMEREILINEASKC